jgi:ABC-type branched-subunit amino acid transport system ATPase component
MFKGFYENGIRRVKVYFDHNTPISRLKWTRKRCTFWGENGMGKSTLLKTLVGLIPPLSGSFTVGENVDAMSGATITSQAVLDGVNAALAYVAGLR